jgi:peptide chain release factor 2
LTILKELEDYLEILAMASEDDPIVKEIDAWSQSKQPQVDHIELESLFRDARDEKAAFLTIRAGAGGTDASDFAEMLARMYQRWCERNGYEVSLLDWNPSEEAGIKMASYFVRGAHAFGYLKAEMGVHRLVRISPYNASNKRQTSFAAVDVMPEMDDINVEIKEADLVVETMRAGGPGGQHVNKTESAVRMIHKPTGITVECRSERSQHLNRRMAMKMMASKLYRYEEAKREKELGALIGERGEVTFGSQIRSYVLNPYKQVKDHRTGVVNPRVEAVLDGDLTEFMEAYLRGKRGGTGPEEEV